MSAWLNVRQFRQWQPHVFCEPCSVQAAMHGIAMDAGARCTINPQRRGVLSNPWFALNTAFEGGADFTVLAEDDVLVSDDTLEFFAWASEQFQAEHVLAVCAWSPTVDTENREWHVLRENGGFRSLIWGTWRDRWSDVLRDTWDHDYSSGTPEQPQSGWDWNLNLRVMKDWDIVSPIASRSTHIGEMFGTHTTSQTFPGSVAPSFQLHREPGFYVISS